MSCVLADNTANASTINCDFKVFLKACKVTATFGRRVPKLNRDSVFESATKGFCAFPPYTVIFVN